MATKTSVVAVSAEARGCCALPVALALLGLSLKAGGGLELLVQDPAAAPSVSVGFCEAGSVKLVVRMYPARPGGLLRADQTPSSAAAVATGGCAESLVLPAQPAPFYLLPPGRW